MGHFPVMLDACVDALVQQPDGCYVDGTVGGGGHTEAILHRLSEEGSLIGFDRDEQAIARVKKRLSGDPRLSLVHSNFANMAAMLDEQGVEAVDGLFLDLGVSSFQLDEAERGFSFQSKGPLDMRMDQSEGLTAQEWIAQTNEIEMADAIHTFGEERAARRIARAIRERRTERPFETTDDLATLVEQIKGRQRGARTHPATLTFQAIRMVINRELESIESVLNKMIKRIRVGGRLVILTFHSLEDRLVKQFFAGHVPREVSLQEGGVRIEGERPFVSWMSKKPICADKAELKINPRSRSAKLRVVTVEG
ncbi:MAG: 16S rRNA (cytosine(1402)-N(4))-methyltransferase RsmH [Pontiellaceae bacterium]